MKKIIVQSDDLDANGVGFEIAFLVSRNGSRIYAEFVGLDIFLAKDVTHEITRESDALYCLGGSMLLKAHNKAVDFYLMED
jgi:hypothetical protein